MTATRQRLSPHRLNGVRPDGPFEGIPDHLRHVIMVWFRAVLSISGSGAYRLGEMRELAVHFRVNMPVDYDAGGVAMVLEGLLDNADDEIAIDMIDATLDVLGPASNDWYKLQQQLNIGASAWKVADDRKGLTRVVADKRRKPPTTPPRRLPTRRQPSSARRGRMRLGETGTHRTDGITPLRPWRMRWSPSSFRTSSRRHWVTFRRLGSTRQSASDWEMSCPAATVLTTLDR